MEDRVLASDMFYKKNVLIAGGAGFIGFNLVNALLDRGAYVRATVHRKSLDLHTIINRGVTPIWCDLTNKDACEMATRDMDYVFMCAANTSGAAVMEKTPLVHVTPNVLMNTLMLEAAYEAKVKKFMFVSSNAVYPVTDYPVKEDEMMKGDLFEKYFCAGWMKRFSEIMCEMYATKIKNPMDVVVVRPGNVYGEHDDFEWETSHVLPAIMRRVVERHDPIEVWGDGNDIKDFIYVKDLVDGMLICMERVSGFDQINIASGVSHTIREALDIMIGIEGYNANIQFDESKPTMIPIRLIDVSKAEELGFSARTSIHDGLNNTISWYKNEIKHCTSRSE